MPVLIDPKKERFAQNLAAGAASQTAAYKAAGFRGEGSTARAAAARLAAQDSIRQRVSELQAERLQLIREEQAKIAQEAGIDLPWLQKKARQILEAAMEEKDFCCRQPHARTDRQNLRVLGGPFDLRQQPGAADLLRNADE